jgi:hypothetical protein
MATDELDNESAVPAPAEIEIKIGEETHRLRYEQAFVLACTMVERGQAADAARLFERLEEFTDHGPRAFIMQAFCEAAAMQFAACSRPLAEAFDGEQGAIASALHNAFVSYHVGIRKDGLNAMIELVNKHPDFPTLSLLLGNMLEAADQLPMARKCWSLAVHRDRQGGAVAAAAMQNLKRTSDGAPAPGDKSP